MIPIPERMRYLGVDHRGYAQFFVALRDASGKCHFIINDESRTMQCATEDLCSLCGTKLQRGRWFVGGPLSAIHDHGAYFDPPMHFECMRYAVNICPWLAAKNYARKQELNLKKISEDVGTTVIDKTIIPERPAVFVCAHARGQTFSCSRDGILRFVPKRPFIALEFWRQGEKLPASEGMLIAAKSLLAFERENR